MYTKEQRSLLVSMGYDIGEAAWADHVELFATEKQALLLSLRGYQVVPKAEPDDFPPEDSNYHNYAEMVADIQAFAAAHPALVHVFSLGTWYEGRDLIGVRISNDATDNLSEPGAFYVGQHHAREHLTVEVALSVMHMFLEKPQLEDGPRQHAADLHRPEPEPGRRRVRHRDRHRTNSGARTGSRTRRRSAPTTTATTATAGAAAAGRAATAAARPIAARARFRRPRTRAWPISWSLTRTSTTGISYHSYGDLILYPYGYTYEDEPADMDHIDHQTFVAMGAEMERTAGYHAQQSSDLYITDGDWNDYMYGASRRYPITIELSGGTFYPPDEFIPGESLRNLPGRGLHRQDRGLPAEDRRRNLLTL